MQPVAYRLQHDCWCVPAEGSSVPPAYTVRYSNPFVPSVEWNSTATHFALAIDFNRYDAFVTLRFARASIALYRLFIGGPRQVCTLDTLVFLDLSAHR